MKRANLILLLALFLSACGFHLRGGPPENTVYFQALTLKASEHQRLVQHLRQALQLNGTTLYIQESLQNSHRCPELRLLEVTFTNRTLAYGANAQSASAQMQLLVVFDVIDKNQTLIKERPLTVVREYTAGSSLVLQWEAEQSLLREQLYQEAARLLSRQLFVPSV